MDQVVKADLVYVRLSGGGRVQLHGGDPVPANADADHVKHLASRGVLGDPEPTPEPSSPKGRRGGGQGQGD